MIYHMAMFLFSIVYSSLVGHLIFFPCSLICSKLFACTGAQGTNQSAFQSIYPTDLCLIWICPYAVPQTIESTPMEFMCGSGWDGGCVSDAVVSIYTRHPSFLVHAHWHPLITSNAAESEGNYLNGSNTPLYSARDILCLGEVLSLPRSHLSCYSLQTGKSRPSVCSLDY